MGVPKIPLADMPRNVRPEGKPLILSPRTDKSVGIDVSGDATMEVYHRARKRDREEAAIRRPNRSLARASRIFGRLFA